VKLFQSYIYGEHTLFLLLFIKETWVYFEP